MRWSPGLGIDATLRDPNTRDDIQCGLAYNAFPRGLDSVIGRFNSEGHVQSSQADFARTHNSCGYRSFSSSSPTVPCPDACPSITAEMGLSRAK
jgi:hypothetical protein